MPNARMKAYREADNGVLLHTEAAMRIPFSSIDGNADTAAREETCQPTFGAPPPVDLLPFRCGQQRFGRDRGLIENMLLARLSGLHDGKDQVNVGGVDGLAS